MNCLDFERRAVTLFVDERYLDPPGPITMDSPERHRPKAIQDASEDSLSQTQALRRKVIFWRRIAWLALGGASIVLLVIWTRGQTRRQECYAALKAYADMAWKLKLAEQHPSILEQQWQEFDQSALDLSPEHYDLIAKNWAVRPGPNEDIVLAVCRDPHLLVFSSGRHVLKRHGEGFIIEWLSEAEAAPIAAEARKDNRAH